MTGDGQTTRRDAGVRDSEVALVPRTNAVRCVERRARALQGWRADLWIERLRTQRYHGPGGHYAHHFDWGTGALGWGRVSSISKSFLFLFLSVSFVNRLPFLCIG